MNEPASSFRGILFDGGKAESLEEPDFFRDLNLDQIVNAVAAGRDEYGLKPLFYSALTDVSAVEHRQEIFRDLERGELLEKVRFFSRRMREVRESLATAEKSNYKYERQGWILDAIEIYGEAVEKLQHDLSREALSSAGLIAFRDHLAAYLQGDPFKRLVAESRKLKSNLGAIKHCVLIKENRVTVRKYHDEADYSTAVAEMFAKFKDNTAAADPAKFTTEAEMSHVQAMIVDRVALLYPDVFRALDEYCTNSATFLDETIAAFNREIQFFVAWNEFIERFKDAGLKFCYPQISSSDKALSARESFDLALAIKLLAEKLPIVCNDFVLTGQERVFVITGPNQGGKTTFARMFGQLHFLARLGCSVPGAEAQLFLCDELLAHFEREESLATLRGKLQDDLVRIQGLLQKATSRSLIIINEIFSSTTLEDAVYLGRKIMERISEFDAICVCVTFLDELASFDQKTVSMVATVVPENPTLRTYRIERKPADGLSYSLAIAEKHHLTFERLRQRIGQ